MNIYHHLILSGNFKESLIKPFLQNRYQNPTGLQTPVLNMIKECLNIVEETLIPAVQDESVCIEEVKGQDYKQKKQKLAKSKWVCSKCNRSICKNHFKPQCLGCMELVYTCNICEVTISISMKIVKNKEIKITVHRTEHFLGLYQKLNQNN